MATPCVVGHLHRFVPPSGSPEPGVFPSDLIDGQPDGPARRLSLDPTKQSWIEDTHKKFRRSSMDIGLASDVSVSTIGCRPAFTSADCRSARPAGRASERVAWRRRGSSTEHVTAIVNLRSAGSREPQVNFAACLAFMINIMHDQQRPNERPGPSRHQDRTGTSCLSPGQPVERCPPVVGPDLVLMANSPRRIGILLVQRRADLRALNLPSHLSVAIC